MNYSRDQKALYSAIVDRNLVEVQRLVDTGAVDLNPPLTDTGCIQDRPLILASGNIDMVRLFLDRGADVNQANELGYTALMASGSVEVTLLLLQRGAHINAQDNLGFTALHGAAHYGYVDIIRVLLDHGADRTIENFREKTAEEDARKAGQEDARAILRDYGQTDELATLRAQLQATRDELAAARTQHALERGAVNAARDGMRQERDAERGVQSWPTEKLEVPRRMATFWCEAHKRSFATQGALDQHLSSAAHTNSTSAAQPQTTQPPEPPAYYFSFDNTTFSTERILEQLAPSREAARNIVHTTENQPRFICTIHEKEFTTQAELDLHLSSGTHPRFACAKCSRNDFTTQAALDIHVSIEHHVKTVAKKSAAASVESAAAAAPAPPPAPVPSRPSRTSQALSVQAPPAKRAPSHAATKRETRPEDVPQPGEDPGRWVLRDNFTGQHSLGYYECTKPDCGKYWVSGLSYPTYGQGCRKCETFSLPLFLWVNDQPYRRRRPEERTEGPERPLLAPHDEARCQACKANYCIYTLRRTNGY